jgi:hypothetical protein
MAIWPIFCLAPSLRTDLSVLRRSAKTGQIATVVSLLLIRRCTNSLAHREDKFRCLLEAGGVGITYFPGVRCLGWSAL